mmetsp:Transcript_15276/g.27466  ORF Transcript_15276/g.27466 Transcript_15276/m.27466 type:complete len:540 (-) Transcript_15276:523-2142(-)|eukprot:CAMPEP_0197526414 /NCGR_PEP_ID=MMETSP1318-20131121/17768_1 /TAXON_ID=552666 /ORGANISM="Partenskyella glossopodia, Strain RCC365" /LENGTH=539 /DNA_ID=CAMNT_0043080567 /DNA_START=158 /DNA_END=1777 /DNA_ORIENTATION=+
MDPIDPDEENEIPVFKPDWETFKDFSKFMTSVEAKCVEFGLCKIIPPKEFIARARGYQFDKLGYCGENPRCDPHLSPKKGGRKLRMPTNDPAVIHNPVKQHLNGSRGVYEVISIVDTDFMTVGTFEEECRRKMENLSQREKENFKKEKLRELERSYWSNLSNRSPPLYGADSPGSLFDESQDSWNCNKLGTLLDLIRDDLPGVTLPMLYFGMWRSMFAWHVEDMNLFSINYLHFGKPKQWYAIPGSHFEKTERVLKGLYPLQARQCAEFLRHKKCMVSPKMLKKYDIPVYRAVQREGEFIITFPKAFHAGFNYGFNCAESVNFALKSWVEEGCKAKVCRCIHDSVRIDMVDFVQKMLNNKYIKRTDPLLKIAKEAREQQNKTRKWNRKVAAWSCPCCTFVNQRCPKNCQMCRYRPNKKQMKLAAQRAKELNESQSEESESVASTQPKPTIKAKRSLEGKSGSPKKKRKKTYKNHPLTKLFTSINISGEYAQRLIVQDLSIDDLSKLERAEMVKLLPLGPRVKLRSYLKKLQEEDEDIRG